MGECEDLRNQEVLPGDSVSVRSESPVHPATRCSHLFCSFSSSAVQWDNSAHQSCSCRLPPSLPPTPTPNAPRTARAHPAAASSSSSSSIRTLRTATIRTLPQPRRDAQIHAQIVVTGFATMADPEPSFRCAVMAPTAGIADLGRRLTATVHHLLLRTATIRTRRTPTIRRLRRLRRLRRPRRLRPRPRLHRAWMG
jgi:hypothetical protein